MSPKEKFEAIGSKLTSRHDQVAMSQMFGMPTLKVNGKAFAGFHKEEMVFKLTGEAHLQARNISGAKLFDPGMGRPMKEWVQVPVSGSSQWQSLAEAALDFVSATATKQPAKKAGNKKKQ